MPEPSALDTRVPNEYFRFTALPATDKKTPVAIRGLLQLYSCLKKKGQKKRKEPAFS